MSDCTATTGFTPLEVIYRMTVYLIQLVVLGGTGLCFVIWGGMAVFQKRMRIGDGGSPPFDLEGKTAQGMGIFTIVLGLFCWVTLLFLLS